VGNSSSQFYHAGLFSTTGLRFTADAPAQATGDSYVTRGNGGSLYYNVSANEVHEFRVGGNKVLEIRANGGLFFDLNHNQVKKAQFIELQEITTPTATADYGKIYTKNTNVLYFQDGAGTEHQIAVV
jgi:hypothetical protein